VVSNLLQNAIKFTPAEGRFAISGTLSQRELLLSVQDSGGGIGHAMLPRIFEPFMKEQPGAEHAGLGLGLPRARQPIELHGGSIAASSEGENRGSCFSIRIPTAAGGNASSPPIAQQSNVIAHRRILVIDDNVDAANSMAMLLQRFGASTQVAHDGPTGLRLAEQFRPDAVLLDIGMPGMDGFETCQRLGRLLGEPLRIVPLTGWGQQRDREATGWPGATNTSPSPQRLPICSARCAHGSAPRAGPRSPRACCIHSGLTSPNSLRPWQPPNAPWHSPCALWPSPW